MVVKFRNFVLAGLAVSLVKGNTFNPRSCQPAIDNGQFRDLVFKSDNLGGGIKAICWPPSLFTIGFDANQIPLLECEDGSFLSRGIPACNPSRCPDTGDLSNTLLRTVDHGLVLEVFCHTSLDKFDWTTNFPEPDAVLRCQNSRWSRDPPVCNDTFVSFRRGLRKLNRSRSKLSTPGFSKFSSSTEAEANEQTTSSLNIIASPITECLKDCDEEANPVLAEGLAIGGILVLIVAIPVSVFLFKKFRQR